MWRILRWVLLGLGILVVAVIALPFLLPTSVYKEQIIEQARLATGRELRIDGDLSISLWPTLGVEVNEVHFANAPGASEAEMAGIESLVVGAELFPLIAGNLKVTELKLIKPVIHLEIDDKGRGNWLFAPAQPAPAPDGGQEPGATTEAPPSVQRGSLGDLSFRDVAIEEGTLTYRDARSGTVQRVDGIDVAIKLPSLDEPMTFAGALTWNKETIEVDATLANPRALSDGGKSELKADVAAEVMNATFAGDVDAGQGSVAGKVDFRTPSARRLAAWAGVDLPKVKGFGAMTMSGTMTSHAGRVAFKKAKLSLDAMNGSGNLELDTTGTLPHVQGDFTLDRLDLNPYLGGGAQGRGSAGGAVPAWSEAALDFSALRSVDADFDFAVDALSVGDMKIGRSALAMVLRGGKLRATLKQLALYGGNGRGTITLDGAKGQPAFALDLNVAGVAAEPFLTDAIGFTKITGTASIVTKITGSGRSQRAWMRSLGGAASIRFEDGAIKGVNLAEIARTIQSALTGTAVGGAAKTDFAELSGTFAIKGGVAANKDLKLLNPFVRLNGGGIVDIGGQSLDYRVEPKAVSSIKGQGGKHELAGIGIPFRIKGPWSNPTYEPDLSGVMSSTVDAILKGENPLKTLKGEGGLGGLLQGLQGDAGEPQEEAPETKDQKPKPAPQNPLDPLKELFGGNR